MVFVLIFDRVSVNPLRRSLCNLYNFLEKGVLGIHCQRHQLLNATQEQLMKMVSFRLLVIRTIQVPLSAHHKVQFYRVF